MWLKGLLLTLSSNESVVDKMVIWQSSKAIVCWNVPKGCYSVIATILLLQANLIFPESIEASSKKL